MTPPAVLWPQLAPLLVLDSSTAGWRWRPVVDEHGVDELGAVREWPGAGMVDALSIRSATDAAAIRATHTDHAVWTAEGTLADVVGELLDLPAPDPFAQHLVRGAAPQLWTPGGRP